VERLHDGRDDVLKELAAVPDGLTLPHSFIVTKLREHLA
jgi:hypothetical protein